mmetsp:Transcript_12527/g.37674  ORF Transcript_12527/g.37674 Transcript_12527/m.37674 type:complete len:245 (-) Transcript_12527:48-782(-)
MGLLLCIALTSWRRAASAVAAIASSSVGSSRTSASVARPMASARSTLPMKSASRPGVAAMSSRFSSASAVSTMAMASTPPSSGSPRLSAACGPQERRPASPGSSPGYRTAATRAAASAALLMSGAMMPRAPASTNAPAAAASTPPAGPAGARASGTVPPLSATRRRHSSAAELPAPAAPCWQSTTTPSKPAVASVSAAKPDPDMHQPRIWGPRATVVDAAKSAAQRGDMAAKPSRSQGSRRIPT